MRDADSVAPDDPLRNEVVARIKTVYDPEIPVNLYDLGLIYRLDLEPAGDGRFRARVVMTLTTPHCPVAGEMPERVRQAIATLPEIAETCVELVWDPPWDKSRLSDEARLQLDMF